MLSRAVVVLQIIQLVVSGVSMYMDERRSGIQTGPISNPNQLTIADPTKAATALNGQTIEIDRGGGYGSFYDVKDGQYLRNGCSKDCAVNPDTLKGTHFKIINPKDLS